VGTSEKFGYSVRRFSSLVVLVAVALSGSMNQYGFCADAKEKKPQAKQTKATKPLKQTNKDAKPLSPLEKANELFTAELKKYVTNGSVNYAEWKKDPKPLNDYLAELSKFSKSEYEHLSNDEKLIFWINAYNAFTIKLVLENYPIKGTKTYYPASSIRQIDGFWEENSMNLAGRKVTLESMEHDILRRDFQEPRIHFAVVPAAKGCGRIRDTAYSVSGLNQTLDQNTSEFLANPKNVSFDTEKKLIKVSQLFKWFPLDFATVVGLGKRFPPPTDDEIVAAYVIMKAPDAVQKKIGSEDATKYKVVYQEYDWSLNDSASSVTK
jgi:hypothetical protein